jgi:hypothetical protein
MRRLLLIPASIALTAAGGMTICVALHKSAHPMEMSLPAMVVTLASTAACVPLYMARNSDQLAASQAALVATMAHLFVAVALAAIAILGHFPLHGSFLIWLSAFYWMTLIALVMVVVRMIKTAPPSPAPSSAPATSQKA